MPQAIAVPSLILIGVAWAASVYFLAASYVRKKQPIPQNLVLAIVFAVTVPTLIVVDAILVSAFGNVGGMTGAIVNLAVIVFGSMAGKRFARPSTHVRSR